MKKPQKRLQLLIDILFSNFPEVGLYKEENENSPLRKIPWAGFSQVLMEFWLQAERSENKEALFEQIAKRMQKAIELWTDVLEESETGIHFGVDPAILARLLFALRDGISIQLRAGSIKNDDHILPQIRQLLLSAVTKNTR